MEVLYPHCAGLDVHKDTVVACVRHTEGGSRELALDLLPWLHERRDPQTSASYRGITRNRSPKAPAKRHRDRRGGGRVSPPRPPCELG
jgi:hypothetical protein